MATTTKTIVQVIQELISLQSAKLEKVAVESPDAEMQLKDDDPVIKKLMNELSQHGDASGSSVEKIAAYYDEAGHNKNLFQDAINNLLKEAGELPESLEEIIKVMR